MKFFPKGHTPPTLEAVDTPVGAICPACNKPIEKHDRGFIIPHVEDKVTERPWHRACFLFTIGVEDKS